MPLYLYECPKCKKQLEIMCDMDKRDKQKCPHCKKKLKRLLSSFGFKINGANFSNGYTIQKK